MKRTLRTAAAALALTVGFAGSASAQNITYTTLFSTTGIAGSFTPTLVQTFGGGTLTYVGQPVTTVTGPFSFIDFGTVLAAGAGTPTGNIFLQIVQSTPTSGSGVATGLLSGSFTASSSGALITWTTNTVVIDGETYVVEPLSGRTSINAPTTGPQTIRGQVTAVTATPEPASLVLLGTGLVGIFGAARRRRQTA